MNVKPQEFAKTSIDSTAFFAKTALDSIERFTALNIDAARGLTETSFANFSALLSIKDPQSLASMQQSLAAPVIEQGLEYSRKVYALTTDTKEKFAQAIETRVAEANAAVSGMVDKALASAPAGSEVAVAAVKSAMAAASDAYEGISKVSKQMAGATEASFAATAEATLKAAQASASKNKKA